MTFEARTDPFLVITAAKRRLATRGLELSGSCMPDLWRVHLATYACPKIYDIYERSCLPHVRKSCSTKRYGLC